jgi:predicted glycoside hydrolase/deacetylase ChbG (UPF0249 family)
VPALKRILETLPEGITELGCHAGYGEGLATVYRAERAQETKVLCDPEVRAALRTLEIQLRSFEGIADLLAPAGHSD